MPDIASPPVPPRRPIWLPDTQGFLAIAIILIMGYVVEELLNTTPKFDDKTAGVLMTVLGVMLACLKDVFSYHFGSSKGEDKKGDIISTIATSPTPVAPTVPPTLDQLAETTLIAPELVFFKTLGDDDAKKKFLAMTPDERVAAIGKG